MTAQLAPRANQKFWDNNGLPLAFGQLFTYQAGTTTPQATYVDSTQTTQNTNPVQLNFRGECNLWLDPTKSYKFLLQDVLGNTIPGWPVDNITIGNANPSFSIIPTSDNLYTLGSPLFSWANIYVGVNHAPVLDTVSGNIGYYARTAAEIAASVTPSNLVFPTTDLLTPLRYGAAGDGVTDDTVALQRWLSVLGQSSDRLVGYLPASTYKFSSNLTVPANVTIMGANNQTSILKPTNAVTQALTTANGVKLKSLMIDGINTTNATGLVLGPVGPDYNEIRDVWVQNFVGSGANNGIGILVQNVVSLLALRMFAVGCNVGMKVLSTTPASLPTTCLFDSCRFRTSVSNAGSVVNATGIGAWVASGQLVTFRDCIFEVNTAQGLFVQAAGGGIVTDLSVQDCWFEDNWHGYTTSSALTFTASVGGASSGTLNASWTGPTGPYTVTFSDNEVRQVTLTNGATTATWSPALSAGTITTATVNVYSLHVDGTTGSGANVTLSGLHFTQGSVLSARKSMLLGSCLARLSRIRSFFGFAQDISVTGGGASLVYVTDDPYDRCGRFINNPGNAASVNYPPYLPIIDLGTGFSVLPTIEKLVGLTYSASMTPDLQNGNAFTIQVSNTTAFTINTPLNTAGVQVGKRMSIRLNNVSGSNTLGAVTWGAGYKTNFATAASAPANNTSLTIEFEWDGAHMVECYHSPANVPV